MAWVTLICSNHVIAKLTMIFICHNTFPFSSFNSFREFHPLSMFQWPVFYQKIILGAVNKANNIFLKNGFLKRKDYESRDKSMKKVCPQEVKSMFKGNWSQKIIFKKFLDITKIHKTNMSSNLLVTCKHTYFSSFFFEQNLVS